MSVQYPDFVEATGYGDVAGLGGANCRHSFGVYLLGISPPPPTEKELAEMGRKAKETKQYKWRDSRGVESKRDFTLRQALDRQREMERQMRYTRRTAAAMEAAGQYEAHEILRARYQAQRAEYKRFSRDMDIIEQLERVYMDGLGRT